METRLIETRKTSNYHGCSRTDKGVSAFEQVISIDVRSKVNPEDQLTRDGVNSELNYCWLLNRKLPKPIRATSWRPLITPNYSARFGCIDRTYKYFFPRGELNIERMQEACKFFVGTHDFRNFCKLNVENGVVNHIRRLNNMEIKLVTTNQDGINAYDMLYLEIKGSAFLWHMIRCIVSVLMMVGQERESPEVVKELLDIEQNDGKPNYDFADEVPLNLFLCNLKDDHDERDEIRQNSEMLNQVIYDESTLKEVIMDMQQQWCYKSVKTTMIYEILKALQHEYSERFPQQPAINEQVTSLIKDNAGKKLMDRQRGPSVAEKIKSCLKKKRIEKVENLGEIKSKI
jgi:tRNA pseudouridine38/39 synthase